MGMVSIVTRGDLLRKLNFSKEIIVISSVVGAAINYGINLLVVFVFALVNGVHLSWNCLVIIPLFIELAMISAGVAFILAALFVKYRDLGPIWEVVMQAGMYATPVIYSLTFIIQKNQFTVAKLMMLNPLAQIIQDMRHYIVYSGSMRGWELYNNHIWGVIPYILPVLILIVGYSIFHKHAKKFAEIL